VIEGALSAFGLQNWTVDRVVDDCATSLFAQAMYSPELVKEWAKMTFTGQMTTLREFVDKNAMFSERAPPTNATAAFSIPRVFDDPFLERCPGLASDFRMPGYFAGDLRQAFNFGTVNHPSIFLDPRKSNQS
jgi:hypothetical protein